MVFSSLLPKLTKECFYYKENNLYLEKLKVPLPPPPGDRATSSNRANMSASVSDTGTSRYAANSDTSIFAPFFIRALSAYLPRSFSSFSGFRLNKEEEKVYFNKITECQKQEVYCFKTYQNIKIMYRLSSWFSRRG